MSKKAAAEKTAPVAPPSDTPAYFLSVSVETFRCFGEKQTLDLSDGNGNPKLWTIILGDNGVGKTTLLQTAAILRPISSPRYRDRASSPATFEFDYLKKDEYWLHNKDLFGEHRPSYLSAEFSSVVVTKSRHDGGRIRGFELKAEVRGAILRCSCSNLPEHVAQLACYGYGASRRPGLPAIREEQDQDTCASLFNADAELINPVEGLLQADYAASKGHERAQKRLQTIKDVFIGLLPDVEDFKFGPLNNETDLPTAQAKTPYGWVPVRSLSLGYQSMMTWTLDLATRLFARYPDSPNPLAEAAVVLVDEIDLHLHPKWQRTLIQYLTETFPKTQFIVTAHSPLVVQAAPDANIVVLRREGDHVVIDNSVKVIEGWRADQILTSDLFGLSSARPPEWDAYLDERDQILAKHTLSDQDRARLEELENLIAELPTGESSSDMEAMDIIRRAATMLKRRGNSGR